jgi:N-acetylglutamate synthase-like GNAT family acetyltransferase
MSGARITIRSAETGDGRKLHALISANLEQGRLLPRALPESTDHATRFVLALRGRKIMGCAELAPLSPQVAEVRSLVVMAAERGCGAGRLIVEELRRR